MVDASANSATNVVSFPSTEPGKPAGLQDDLQDDLLVDCQNLADECQELVRSLQPFAFPNTGLLIVEHYAAFLKGRRVADYRDWTQQLANKVHGLKGVLGFLIPEGKKLCHHAEEIIKPLAQAQLLLDDRLHDVLTRFIYQVQGMLEAHQKQPGTPTDLAPWIARFEAALAEARVFMEGEEEAVAKLLADRARDDGEVRARRRLEHLSVSREGYEALVEEVNRLYGVIAAAQLPETVAKASRIYNDFLDAHQRIKKLPLDVSRYERLVPSLAEKYDLRARFVFLDTGVLAEHEFWSAIHEMLNHLLKNAIIHGIEAPVHRVKAGKDETGSITIALEEDLLHIVLTVRDDGRGIDPQRVAAKALENGAVTAERLERMPTGEVLALIFEQGVSTQEAVDDNAGRGIGMGAVREAMTRYDGAVAIDSQPGQGTEMRFRFPKINVSLPCFVVRVGDYPLALPEAQVAFFAGFDPARVESVHGRPVYRHGDALLPLLYTRQLFEADITASEARTRRLLVVESGALRHALVINEVVDKGMLPLFALGEDYGSRKLFIGSTLHETQPLMVLDVTRLAAYA